MPDTFNTLAQLITVNDKNAVDLGVTDIFNDAPVLRAVAATPASNGTLHKYLKESGAPTVGFRAVNTGIANSGSTDTLVTATLALLDASFHCDKAIADSYKGGPDSYIAREALRHLKQALFVAEKQVIGGTIGGSAGGFSGIANVITTKTHDYAVNAAGTTASTGSSVYLVRTANDGSDLQVVIGNDGQVKIDDTVVTTISEEDEYGVTTGRFTAYHTPIMGYMGLQYGGVAAVVRICNLTEDSGKGLTDLLLADALAKFPASRQPNQIWMNRRSLKQLQKSRTATNATGAPAPRPTEYEGIPIIVTDAITSTETLLS